MLILNSGFIPNASIGIGLPLAATPPLLWGIMVVVSLLTLAISWFIVNRFWRRPLHEMIRALQPSNRDIRLQTRYRVGELNELATAFNQMAASLEQQIVERERAELLLGRQVARVEHLAELSELLAETSHDYEAVLDLVARRLSELVGDTCIIQLISDDGKCLIPAAIYHPDSKVIDLIQKLLDSSPQGTDEGVNARVLKTGQPLLVPVTSPEQVATRLKPEYQPYLDQVGIHSLILVPLRSHGETIGMITLLRDSAGRPYTVDDQTFLIDLAERAALAISNARLFTAVQRELAERKHAEAEVMLLNAKLEHRVVARTAQLQSLNRELKKAKEVAEEANLTKSEFLSRMSHELRTPLNAILGFAQVLQMDELPASTEEGIQQILKAGRHLLALINEVLDIARIESGHLSLSLEPVHVANTIEEVSSMVQPLASQQHVRVQVELPATDDWHVQADLQRFKQVLLNLMSNAVNYNRVGGVVMVEGEERARSLRLWVRDTGPGIAAEKITQLFTPFERLGAEQTEVQGIGLGLAISRHLMEAMGGRIGVESTPGEGSSFWVELPLTERLQAPAEPIIKEATKVLVPISKVTNTLLYLEDNLSNLSLLQAILSHQTRIQLLTAVQGRLGLELARKHLPKVILMDLNLPDMTGLQVLQQLQSDPALCEIPVLVISADATPHQIERLLAAGARAYLTKPLDVPQFLEVLNETLLSVSVP